MRLKFSFEDITCLFRYLDQSGDGTIGYEEFTMLLEEKWRGIDPYKMQQDGKKARQHKDGIVQKGPQPQNVYGLSRSQGLNIYNGCTTEQDVLEKLESMAVDR